jgi:large subunit ribosomal protein L16
VQIWPGRILFEVDGVEEKLAIETLTKAAKKLPLKARVVSRAH